MRTFANAINSDFINTRMGQDLMINNLCALLHIVKVSFLHVRWMNSALHYVVCNPDDPENARPYSFLPYNFNFNPYITPSEAVKTHCLTTVIY